MDRILRYAKLFKRSVEEFEIQPDTFEVRESSVHGNGVFSKEHIEPGFIFHTSLLDKNPEFRGFNHSQNPNVKMMSHSPSKGSKMLVIKEISPDDELFVEYTDTSSFEDW